ncbi:MAG: Gfo/Idh/MocA family oxidoreductase [Bryobacterales bacterium]|nr:Gfo/Idh/MocA family oxidoreductase [Bryobacterales bacterium]
MSAKQRLRVALIGQGSMGRAHSNAFHQVNHFFDTPYDLDLALICGRNPENLQRMAARWGWRETATDWRAVMDRLDIDIVNIALPNYLHSEVALAAAGAGKIVLCEKPLATSVDDARRMAQAVRGKPNMVWFNYRRVPSVAFTRRLIDQNRIGAPFHYRGFYCQEWGNDPSRPPSWKTDPAQAGSGVLGDILSHAVDLALYLNGPIAEVSAMQHTFAANRQVDDATLVLVRFANGSVGTLEATRFATGFKNRNAFELHGARGAVRFNLEDMNRLEFADATDDRELQGFRNLLVNDNRFWKPGHIVGYEHTFIAALGEFLEALHAGLRFRPDFDDALQVEQVLAAVQHSSNSKAWKAVQLK